MDEGRWCDLRGGCHDGEDHEVERVGHVFGLARVLRVGSRS